MALKDIRRTANEVSPLYEETACVKSLTTLPNEHLHGQMRSRYYSKPFGSHGVPSIVDKSLLSHSSRKNVSQETGARNGTWIQWTTCPHGTPLQREAAAVGLAGALYRDTGTRNDTEMSEPGVEVNALRAISCRALPAWGGGAFHRIIANLS